MIPRVAHFYWGEKELPWLRFLTLQTFIKQNPSWKVKLYVPVERSEAKGWSSHEQKYNVSGKDYFKEAKALPIEIIPFDCKTLKISNGISEIHKSDFLRWHLLGTEGGLWSDMDILYFKPIPELRGKTGICFNTKYGHSIGFLFSEPNNPVFKTILAFSMYEYKSDYYQSIGANLLNRHYPRVASFWEYGGFNIPMSWVYPYDATEILKIFVGAENKMTPDTLGIHWFAGHQLAGEFINKATPETVGGMLNILGLSIQKALK